MFANIESDWPFYSALLGLAAMVAGAGALWFVAAVLCQLIVMPMAKFWSKRR